jgi:hypothetical protein
MEGQICGLPVNFQRAQIRGETAAATDAAPKRSALQTLEGVISNIGQLPRTNVNQERIVAVGLLTRNDLNVLGPAFSRAWPVEEAPSFNELLRAIDEADEELAHRRNIGDVQHSG